jgi:hypothetical protein
MPQASILSSKENAMHKTIGKLLLAAGVWLAAAPVFAAEIVVIVNPKNPATRMFSEQAAQFFLGKSTLFTPVEHSDGPLRNEFYKKVLDKDTTRSRPSGPSWCSPVKPRRPRSMAPAPR